MTTVPECRVTNVIVQGEPPSPVDLGDVWVRPATDELPGRTFIWSGEEWVKISTPADES